MTSIECTRVVSDGWEGFERLGLLSLRTNPMMRGMSLSSTRLSLSGTQAPTLRFRSICQSCSADWWDRRWNALSESRKFEERLVLARFFCRASQSRPIKRRTACRNFSRYGTFGGTGQSGLPYGSSNPAALSSSVTRPKCAPTLTLNIARCLGSSRYPRWAAHFVTSQVCSGTGSDSIAPEENDPTTSTGAFLCVSALLS